MFITHQRSSKSWTKSQCYFQFSGYFTTRSAQTFMCTSSKFSLLSTTVAVLKISKKVTYKNRYIFPVLDHILTKTANFYCYLVDCCVLGQSILTMSPFKCSIVITTTCSIPVRITRTVLLQIRLVMNRKFACFHSLSLRITFGHPNPILLFIFFHKKTINAVTRIIGFCPVT